jgi:hypothetical protein
MARVFDNLWLHAPSGVIVVSASTGSMMMTCTTGVIRGDQSRMYNQCHEV